MDKNDDKEMKSDVPFKSTDDDIDLSIFNDIDQCSVHDSKSETTPNLKLCPSLKRVIYALKHYGAMTCNMDNEGVSTFVDFIKSIYKNYLNDIIHLTEVHGDDLEDIHKSLFNEYRFKHCDLRKCKISGRHSAVNGKEEQSIPRHDAFSQFIIDSFDSVHFYLFHLFDVGLRTLRADTESGH